MGWQWVVAVLIVVGFLLTAGNLVAAFLSVRKQVFKEEKRIVDSKALAEEEHAEMDARTPEQGADAAFSAAIHEKYRIRYDERDLIRPNMGNLAYLSAYEAKRIVEMSLDSTRGNLIWAGVGLLVSTVAGVWSIWV